MIGSIVRHERGRDSLFKIWHASQLSMIIFMHSDGGSIVCREKAYPICKGTLCFVGAGKIHYTMPDVPERYDRSKMFFPADLIPKIAATLPRDESLGRFGAENFVYAQIKEPDYPAIEEIFREIEAHQKDPCADRLFLAECLKLLTHLDRESTETIGSVTGIFGPAIEYINDHITSPISIDEICNAVHVSKYHFCRQFKKTTGMTVMQYVQKTRIVTAKNLLKRTEKSVTEISEECGFSSISHFCRIFQQDVGISPLRYRKREN